MTASPDQLDEPPDENEAFANLDESLDDEDAYGSAFEVGPEGERDLDVDLTVDQMELEEAGANFDDPERVSLLQGGMDDPDGTGPPEVDPERGWDIDPCWERPRSSGGPGPYAGFANDAGADGDAVSDDCLLDVPDGPGDPELEISPAADLDEIPDDAPGSDSAHW
ncbi:MAG: hypothetical protein FWC87_11575 [Acidimicrobiaceae bacterium]|nr:hypothetical protein [Acidimicrobiaceae bacterium]